MTTTATLSVQTEMILEVAKPAPVYHYRIKSMGYSSERYGKCEVCGTHCSEVFHQTELREFSPKFPEDFGPIKNAMTAHGCRDGFGHEDCLRGTRR